MAESSNKLEPTIEIRRLEGLAYAGQLSNGFQLSFPSHPIVEASDTRLPSSSLRLKPHLDISASQYLGHEGVGFSSIRQQEL